MSKFHHCKKFAQNFVRNKQKFVNYLCKYYFRLVFLFILKLLILYIYLLIQQFLS